MYSRFEQCAPFSTLCKRKSTHCAWVFVVVFVDGILCYGTCIYSAFVLTTLVPCAFWSVPLYVCDDVLGNWRVSETCFRAVLYVVAVDFFFYIFLPCLLALNVRTRTQRNSTGMIQLSMNRYLSFSLCL